MCAYNVRAYDLHRRPVMSLAVLADSDPRWRPDSFGYQVAHSETGIRCSVVKLLDFRERQAELEASSNPFGLAVLAHLKTQETKGDAENRLAWKLRLARMLFHRRWTRLEVEELFQFFDWVLTLPEAEENRFDTDYTEMENEATMAETMPPFMRRAAVREARLLLLLMGEKRLGEPSEAVRARVEAIQDKRRLERLCLRVLEVETWDDLLAGR